ncbi:MAG: hypothetical protein Q7V63_05540 [Gammaproteobacteria bacterium]|nr:hypothetical protein [Gammaproteobacteria bacterium]
MPACIELVIYQIKPDYQQSFASLRATLYAELKSLAGFIDYKTYQDLENPLGFTDQVTWTDPLMAKQAFAKFMTLHSAPAFMACIDKVILTQHLQESS